MFWKRLNTLTVGQPLVGRHLHHWRSGLTRLNTLTVGQPLVGCRRVQRTFILSGLNTLTVGQPLVGTCEEGRPQWRRDVSIPSQSGSLLSELDSYCR